MRSFALPSVLVEVCTLQVIFMVCVSFKVFQWPLCFSFAFIFNSGYQHICLCLSVECCRNLCSALDGCCVHPLLPHTVHVCQQDAVCCVTEPALHKELAAANAHRKPGTQEKVILRGVTTSLHHSSQQILSRGKGHIWCEDSRVTQLVTHNPTC